MPESPWDDAYRHFIDESMPWLIEHSKAIGEAAEQGNALAERILQQYRLLARSFDLVNAQQLKTALDEWQSTQSQKERHE